MDIRKIETGFEVYRKNQLLLKHTRECPMLFVGKGHEQFDMCLGNFEITEYLEEKMRCVPTLINKNTIYFSVGVEEDDYIEVIFTEENDRLVIDFNCNIQDVNRCFIRLFANDDEKVYGCGEQFSYFNLRGRTFPLWTSEPGVGRDKKSYITYLADAHVTNAGGDYFTTNYPETSYISTRKIYCHVESTAYAEFNFRNKYFHELEFFEVPKRMVIIQGENYINLMEGITDYSGRIRPMPDWVRDGAIIGVQGGTDVALEKLQTTLDNGVKVSGVWCQDWVGVNTTSFGKRLYWDWKWDEVLYPDLDEKIKELNEKGIKFLGYINPYVVKTGSLYKEAKEEGYLVLDTEYNVYDIDFGEFECGAVDLSYEPAYKWYKNVIIKNLIDFGLSGWMADFAEYLPVDCVLPSGEDPKIMHNKWPRLWAKCNYDAVRESGKLGEVFYFMRAGAFGSQKYNMCMWGGDQFVDWSKHDGIATVIPAALSCGIIGNPYHHSDIGGYTSLFDNVRTKELFMRWAELSVFSSLMRTHESNRPDVNFQYYNDEDTMKHFTVMVDLHIALKDYISELIEEASSKGIPLQRPLFMHYEDDKRAYEIQNEFMFGQDLLIAPVLEKECTDWTVYLPEDEWIHLWSEKAYGFGTFKIEAPIGYPPVFYRKESKYGELFKNILIKLVGL